MMQGCNTTAVMAIAGLILNQDFSIYVVNTLTSLTTWILKLLEKYMFYRIQNIRSKKINGFTSFAIDNMYYVNFRN